MLVLIVIAFILWVLWESYCDEEDLKALQNSRRYSKEFISKAVENMRKTNKMKVRMAEKGKKPIVFNKGALHRALKVPAGTNIPAGKKRDALAGKYGARVKRMAVMAFKGALAKGRETAVKNKLSKPNKKRK